MNIAVVTPTTSEHRDFNDQRRNTDLHFSTQVNLDLIQDQIGAMFSQEKIYCIHHNTVQDDASKQGHKELKVLPMEDWRRRICEWYYLVVDYFQIDRKIVAISLNILDRYLSSQHTSKQTPIDEDAFQLVSVSVLYLTTKVHNMNDGIIGKKLSTIEKGRRKILQNSIVELCKGKFTADDICFMEQQILLTLSWNVNPITTSNFVEYFLRLMPPYSTVSVDCQPTYKLSLYVLLEFSRYISELAVSDAIISRTYLPSKIAMACIFLSMDEFNFTTFPWKVRNEFQSTLMKIYDSNSTPWNNDDDIELHRLMEALSVSFWPHLSINETECDHPFDLARKYGLFKPRWLNSRSSSLHVQPSRRQPLDEEDGWILVDDVNPIHDLSEDIIHIVSP